MVTDPEAYEALCETERWQALRNMTIEESIALGEALLTSEVVALAAFGDRPPLMSLAVALGIRPRVRLTK